ncbi:hypothetical protein StoSoilB22_00550 [Arthrobacter sp. StoSoilB22]|nr:hypothetical protein StoSoilB22_00550 [Arthrobacter sp. StoSoilB22]
MDRVALFLKGAAQGPVADATADLDCAFRGVHYYLLGEGVEQDVGSVGVCNGVEGVPGTKGLDAGRVSYELAQLIHSGWPVDVG